MSEGSWQLAKEDSGNRAYGTHGTYRTYRPYEIIIEFVVVAVPGYKPLDALLDCGFGFVVDVLHELIYVGVGVGDVAGLHWKELFFGGSAKFVLDSPDVVHEINGTAVADVVYPPGGTA